MNDDSQHGINIKEPRLRTVFVLVGYGRNVYHLYPHPYIADVVQVDESWALSAGLRLCQKCDRRCNREAFNYRRARGVVKGTEPAEDVIRRGRGNSSDKETP